MRKGRHQMFEIDLRSLKRFREGAEQRFVLVSDFGGRVPDEPTLREIARGVTERLTREGNRTRAGQWVLSSQGWTGWLLDWRDPDDIEEWFAGFASAFKRTDGKVIGGPRNRSRNQADPAPTFGAQLYLTTSDMRLVDSDERGWFWGVDHSTTRYMCEQLLYWTHMPRATEWLASDAWHSFETRGLDHVESMVEMIDQSSFPKLDAALTNPLRYRTAKIAPHGRLAVGVVDTTIEAPERLKLVAQILKWSPPRSDYGYIHHASGNALDSDNGHRWPHVRESAVRYNRPLLASFVPDVHGIQLLTDAHLERAHNLSDWNITHLEGGRHLVVAQDLEAWYQPIPLDMDRLYSDHNYLLPADPDLVAQARADFGDMILTPENIAKYSPWA